MKYLLAMLIAVPAALCGCAANVQKSSSNDAALIPRASAQRVVMNITGSDVAASSTDWEPFKGEWRGAMKSSTAGSGIAYLSEDDLSQQHLEPGTLVEVYVNDYRYLSTGVRYGFGIMTGNAFVDSKVSLIDLQTGTLFEERAYNTTSTAWQGVFSAMTSKQVQAICDEIVREIKSRTGSDVVLEAPKQSEAGAPFIASSTGMAATSGPMNPPRLVGANFGPSPEGLAVISVDKGGVAARAGLKAGDIITHIDGHGTAALYWEYAAARLTQGANTVTVYVLGKGERTLSFAN
jgi:hypothetical protein